MPARAALPAVRCDAYHWSSFLRRHQGQYVRRKRTTAIATTLTVAVQLTIAIQWLLMAILLQRRCLVLQLVELPAWRLVQQHHRHERAGLLAGEIDHPLGLPHLHLPLLLQPLLGRR